VTRARSISRLGTSVVTLVFVSLTFVVLADKASSQTVETFRDNFTSISYSGNNGSLNWSGSWQEWGESNGATSGSVQVATSDRCSSGSGNCLRIGSDGGTLSNHGASRAADLTDAVSATLSFGYRRQIQGQVSGSVTVQVSGNGGSSWTTLTTINFSGPQKASTATFDIGGYTGSTTVVRFRGSGSGINGYLYIDAVEVTADMAASTTTTIVVTTTVPGATTSTTTPGSSTTTVPGATTSTTTPGTPTTTNPASTSIGTPTTTPTAGDTTVPDAATETTEGTTEVAAPTQDESSTDDDLAPMAIAAETVSANAISLAALALLASGLAIAGIDREKRNQGSPADDSVDPEPSSSE
jgi:hypothetical protein